VCERERKKKEINVCVCEMGELVACALTMSVEQSVCQESEASILRERERETNKNTFLF
jgi:hypothetical protein